MPDDSLWRTGNGLLSPAAGQTDREPTDASNTLTVRCIYPAAEGTVHLDGSFFYLENGASAIGFAGGCFLFFIFALF